MSKYSPQEVTRLLGALERQAKEALKLAQQAEQDAHKHSYEMYYTFRSKVQEFETCSIIVEERLKNMASSRKASLEQQFNKLNALMLGIVVRASLNFFYVLSANTHLPMGAREIFLSELRNLYNAKNKLENPAYGSMVDSETAENLQTAEEILAEIIDRAPSMLNLEPEMEKSD